MHDCRRVTEAGTLPRPTAAADVNLSWDRQNQSYFVLFFPTHRLYQSSGSNKYDGLTRVDTGGLVRTEGFFLLVLRQTCLFRCVPSLIFEFHEGYRNFTHFCQLPVCYLRSRRESEEGAPRGRVGIGWSGVLHLGQSRTDAHHLFDASLSRHNPPGLVYQQRASKALHGRLPCCIFVLHFVFTPPSIYSYRCPPRPPLLGGLQLVCLSLHFLFAPSFCNPHHHSCTSRYSRSRAPEE